MDQVSHSVEDTETSGSPERGENRRHLLGKGIRLAAAIPAVLLATQGVAYAERDRPKRAPDPDDDGGDHDHDEGRGPFFRRPFFALKLCRVSTVGSSDFAPSGTSAGSDSLDFGVVRVFRDAKASPPSSRVWVRIVGAAPNTSYTVAFVRFNDHAREALGSITTGPHGRFTGFTPARLAGTNRVGAFVLINNGNGSDQFVTCLP